MSNNPYQPYQDPRQNPNQDSNQPNQQDAYQQPYQSPYQQPYQSPYQQPDYQQPPYGYQQNYQKSAYPQGYQSAYQQPSKTQLLSLDFSLAGLLCYMPLFAINLIASVAFLATEPRTSFFLRFHAIQSVLLSLMATVFTFIIVIAWFSTIAIGAAVGDDAGAVFIGLSFLATIGLSSILGLITLALHIVAMYKAYNNEVWEIPIIGKYARRFSQSA
ncbi:MAG: DUF4870 domain-containing protein [Acidobacteria bacterium]|nr:DUF4870 domain-containing protein [Acidobacteriota bacterium]